MAATKPSASPAEKTGTAPATADQQADRWAEWFASAAPRLLLFARQQTNTPADAEDVLQEAVLRLWDPKAPPPDLPLVFTTIRHTAIDLGRRRDRRDQRERSATTDPTTPTSVPWFEPAITSAGSTSSDDVQAAIGGLPANYRQVVTLKIWGELTFSQIADTLGISPNTAASRYRYALAHLRRQLAS